MTITLTGRTIGENIRLAREQAGLSQTQLGNALLVSMQMISKYEKGAPIGEIKLKKIAEVCGVELEELLKTQNGGVLSQK